MKLVIDVKEVIRKNRKALLYISIILAFALAIGFYWYIDHHGLLNPARGYEQYTGPPGVVLGGEGKTLIITAAEDSPEEHTFNIDTINLHRDTAEAVYPYGDGYIVLDKGILQMYDKDLQAGPSRRINTFGYLKVDYPLIYLAADGVFYICDERLKALSTTAFDKLSELYAKNIHHIIVHDNIAYLLDNFVMPIWVFEVDVSDINQPELLYEYDFGGWDVKLVTQWLEKDPAAWAILSRRSHNIARHSVDYASHVDHVIYYRRLDRGQFAFRRTYEEKVPYADSDAEKIREGKRYVVDSATSPNWFLLEQDDNLSLATTKRSGRFIKFDTVLDMGFLNPNQRYFMAKDDNYLFIASIEKLCVVDLTNEPTLIYQEKLDDYNLEQIGSFLPLGK